MDYQRFVLMIGALCLLHIGSVVGAQESPPARHLVAFVEGDARLARILPDGIYSLPVPLTVGMVVHDGDLINLDPGGRVTILCANNDSPTVEQTSPVPCTPGSVPDSRSYRWGNLDVYRSSQRSSADSVRILFPRHTLLLENEPQFSWTPYQNSALGDDDTVTYQVQLLSLNTGAELWQRSGISTTRLDFPLDNPLPANTPNGEIAQYELRVTPVVNQTPLRIIDPMNPQGFCVIHPGDRQQVESVQQNLQNLDLPAWVTSDLRQFNIASYYHEKGLYAEAAKLLELLMPVSLDAPFPADAISATSLTGSPSFYMLLATVYNDMRLPQEALQALQRAQEIAQVLNDRATLAATYEQIARIERGARDTITPDSMPDVYENSWF